MVEFCSQRKNSCGLWASNAVSLKHSSLGSSPVSILLTLLWAWLSRLAPAFTLSQARKGICLLLSAFDTKEILWNSVADISGINFLIQMFIGYYFCSVNSIISLYDVLLPFICQINMHWKASAWPMQIFHWEKQYSAPLEFSFLFNKLETEPAVTMIT